MKLDEKQNNFFPHEQKFSSGHYHSRTSNESEISSTLFFQNDSSISLHSKQIKILNRLSYLFLLKSNVSSPKSIMTIEARSSSMNPKRCPIESQKVGGKKSPPEKNGRIGG